MMESQERIRATSPAKWIVCSVLLILLFVLYGCGIVPMEMKIFVPVALVAGPCFLATVWQCCNSVYLTEKGIACCRFGRVIRELPWGQVAQVCIANEVSNSSNRIIVITPVGCEAYDREKWYGRKYASRFRNQVVSIDNTKKNREFIEGHFGAIIAE